MRSKKIILSLLPIVICLSGCNQTDHLNRNGFLSCKYNITFACINTTYVMDMTAYPFPLKDSVDCITSFDKENTYADFYTEVINGVPRGYGSLNIAFTDSSTPGRHYDFDYYTWYDKCYGGDVVQTDETKIDCLGLQKYRMRYWWYRVELFLPEISDQRIIAEFHCTETHPEPADFDHVIY